MIVSFNAVPLFWLAWMALLLLVLVAMCRQAPRCPSCGSMTVSKHYRVLPGVRQCAACHEVYEVRHP